METTKVFVVDDHSIFRKGLVQLINDLPLMECVGEASNGRDCLNQISLCQAQVVLMDITMPVMSGIEATREILKNNPAMKVIALSMHDQEEYLDQMLLAGAKGFLLKNVGYIELEKAIDYVMDGKNYYSVELMHLFTQKVLLPHDSLNGDPLFISRREKEVLELICKGMTNQEIADTLFISNRTVENHRAHLIEKTDSKNTVELVLYSIKKKLVKV